MLQVAFSLHGQVSRAKRGSHGKFDIRQPLYFDDYVGHVKENGECQFRDEVIKRLEAYQPAK